MAEPGTFMAYFIDFWLYFGWWFVPLVFLFVYKKKLSKYPIGCTIYEKRGDKQLIVTNDLLGRFDTPVNCYRFKVTKGDSIPIPEYDWILQYMYKPTNIFEKFTNLLAGKIGHITLFKYASKQYKPVNVKLADGSMKQVFKPIKNEKGEEVYIKVYEFINPKQAMQKLDFEVIDWDDVNHMTQELRAIALRRSPIQKFLEKYGAMIGILLAVLALIISGYYVKEMIGSAANTAASMINEANPNAPKAPATPAASAPATQPNIPLIGDLVTPK